MNSRFQKGTGCYRCICCNKLTRATGTKDHENAELCSKCFKELESENAKGDSK